MIECDIMAPICTSDYKALFMLIIIIIKKQNQQWSI